MAWAVCPSCNDEWVSEAKALLRDIIEHQKMLTRGKSVARCLAYRLKAEKFHRMLMDASEWTDEGSQRLIEAIVPKP